MDRQYSAQSFSSRADSDTGVGAEIRSDYEVESGIYMTSCAAKLLVAALISLGALLMTVLIDSTVMFQSFQTQSAGAVEMWNSLDDYSDCKSFALNTELNSLDARSVPSFCKDVAIQYIKQGQYVRNLETTALLAENYLNNIKPLADVFDVVLMDIDDFIPLYSHYYSPLLPGFCPLQIMLVHKIQELNLQTLMMMKEVVWLSTSAFCLNLLRRLVPRLCY